MTTLNRLEESTYVDQYDFEHKCFYAREIVEVTRTDEYYEYEYYGSQVKNFYWDSEDGRRWMCHTPTDFGCPTSWTRRVPPSTVDGADSRVPNEKWIRDDRKDEKPHWYGGTPVVFGIEE